MTALSTLAAAIAFGSVAWPCAPVAAALFAIAIVAAALARALRHTQPRPRRLHRGKPITGRTRPRPVY